MKQLQHLILFLCACCFPPFIANAQEINPYHCDTLQTICFDETKIQIRFFNAPKTCLANCNYCAAIAKEDWQHVQKLLKEEVKALKTSPEPLQALRTRLLAHRLVNFVLPPQPEARNDQYNAMQIGFQVPHMTYTWNATFKRKTSGKPATTYWSLIGFVSDSHIFSRLNTMADKFKENLRADTAHLPEPLLPDQNYLASWFGTRNLSPTEIAEQEKLIRTNPKEAIKKFIAEKDAIGLTLMMAHQNLAVRYAAQEGIKTLRDKTCLPNLLRLAERTIQPVEPNPEVSTLYMNYCEQMVAAIGILTNCSFNRCPFAHYAPQHYLRLGLPTWERRIKHRGGQGIGMYGILLN
ncbi:hypothetical protein I5M27_04625 [Adhaeribacter sp. BT258]|uniref:Uncharacterized protein n=1 Tax=Adhaeribacter terrigena TaxID=2793070 RepID=A0ABS1BYN3_9BACT|nr:hypothetical protein [Adhaeribacter terrigena]MBK0402256.1 hypothetical protein [Adhaeribacter terrigena]